MLDMIPNGLEYVRLLATDNLFIAGLVFWLMYTAITTFSLPGASAFTIASGAIFGIATGGLLSATAAWSGAMVIFLIVKYTSSDFFQRKMEGTKLENITSKIKEHEFKGMLVLRITPVFPFFAVNILAGVLGVSNRTYMITTACGMFWSFVYAGVGAGLFEVLT